MYVLPVTLLPTAITFSCRSTYSDRASSSTHTLLGDGSARKSNLSSLFTAGNFASLMRSSTIHRATGLWRVQGRALTLLFWIGQ